MVHKDIFLGAAALKSEDKEVSGKFVELEKEKFYRISNYDAMDDFFMTIVSPSDHWMYISSNGSLSAGRINRDNALFPYYTVDKIHDYRDLTGPRTWCLLEKDGKTFLWEPFTSENARIYAVERNMYKSMYGNKIIFEEINHELGVSFRYGWFNSDRFGWIRRSWIRNLEQAPLKVSLLDGIRNILPYGADYSFQTEYSNLMDAYKKNELLAESKLGLFVLSSIPVDRAEPSEALKATTVWSCGLDAGAILISDQQLEKFRQGGRLETELDIRASRGAYYVNAELDLSPGEERSWYLVAEINQDAAEVANLDHFLKNTVDIETEIREDIDAGSKALVKIVAGADGLQKGKEELAYARHFSNTLYNIMRGGIYTDDYKIDLADFRAYLGSCNSRIQDLFRAESEKLPDKLSYPDLVSWARSINHPGLERICMEYLPLTFSRRHGDPSRPWNQFSIEIKNQDGSDKLNYQGNWRDIFQNWEALNLSYPEFMEGILAKFLNATTADGYNPYRITREGIDWECPDPEDPWAYIGYWGDHQIIYLQKFLEQARDFHPGRLEAFYGREIFVFANVPYRIKGFEEMVRDPRDTILFDHELNSEIDDRVKQSGSDGRLLLDENGEICRANLLEKILVTLLAKLSNFIPEAGIWLNTQRPEWNDANNALVGNGVSMVTLYYLRRFLDFWKQTFEEAGTVEMEISLEVKQHFDITLSLLEKYREHLEGGFSDGERYHMISELGQAGSRYRELLYRDGFSGKRSLINTDSLKEFMDVALLYLDQSIEKNRREDGLYHAYNLAAFEGDSIRIRHLYEMLEGQVAVLSSGCLSTEDGLEVLDVLKNSRMFREDQYSYMLYPDRILPRFEDKNNIPREKVASSVLLRKLVSEKDASVIRGDLCGVAHFNGTIRNSMELEKALDGLDREKYGRELDMDRALVLELFEEIFDHQSFTGRSGTFYGYEGLGSIYWHMVSKLLLAVQENYVKAGKENADPALLGRLKAHYYEIKAGIGLYKSPALYGAFPTDAYSHTPGGAGAKQPGLTGQVKEDVISRLGELGLRIGRGEISYDPSLLNPDEILDSQETFTFVDLAGKQESIGLEAGQLAFTFCQVPVVVTFAGEKKAVVRYSNGDEKVIPGNSVPADISLEIFSRNPNIIKLEFYVGN